MSYRLLLLASLVGCAQGAHEIVHIVDADRGGDDDDDTIDAPGRLPPHIDAPDGCNPVMTEMLKNPAFDNTPTGTNWTQTPIKPTSPIITNELGPLDPQSGANFAWMGGFTGDTANDAMYEEFTVPPGTTDLTLTGYYGVVSDEGTGFAFDLATVELVKPDGTQIETVMNLDNTMPTADWTAINFTAHEDLSGQTIRLHFASSNDSSNITSFFFDTLSFTATSCP
jgi:hypothetical protein